MKKLFAIFFYLVIGSVYGNSYINLSCFPRVFEVQGLDKGSKINFYDNLKLEGEPVLVLTDKFYFQGDKLGQNVFLDQKKKKINKDLFEKIPELIKRDEGVFIAFCPTATEGVFQFKSKVGDLFFDLKKYYSNSSNSFLIEDQKEIKNLMSKHSGYRKSAEEYVGCIKNNGEGCNEEISKNVKLLLTFLNRIKDKSCLDKPSGIDAQFTKNQVSDLEDPLIIPKKLVIGNDVINEAIGIFQFSMNKNIYSHLRLDTGSLKNEGGLLSHYIYHYKKVDCFSLKGIIISSDYTYGNSYVIQFEYPASGG